MQWFLQLTATLCLCGLIYEMCLALCIASMGLRDSYKSDPRFARRLRLNAKMMIIFTVLSTLYQLMAFNRHSVHKGWIANYYGGVQEVYSFRFIEWVTCSPLLLTVLGALEHSSSGLPRNALVPSSMLTGAYCFIAWQGLVVKDIFASHLLIGFAFVSYFFATSEQLHFALWIKNRGTSGRIRCGLLVYIVFMMGMYGLVYLLPVFGLIPPDWENKFYCIGDASFKLGTSIVLLATEDIANNQEIRRRAEVIADDLARIIDTSSVPIFGVDRHNRINQWNRKIAEMTGLPESSAQNMPLDAIIQGPREEELRDIIQQAFEGSEPGHVEIALDPQKIQGAKDAENMKKAMLVLSAAPRVDRMGITVGVTLVGYDLTKIAVFQEADQRKNTLMAVVSHELRSPLHGIIGLMELLLGDEGDDKKARRMQMILNCAKRLADLVGSIMETALLLSRKPDAPAKQLARDPVDMNKVINEIVGLVKFSNDKRGQSLVKSDVQLKNDTQILPIIEGDAHKCTQVFYNIITNACKFTSKGYIRITSHVPSDGSWIEVKITDTGCGIHKANLERIFKPFEQEDASAGRYQDGIGLGLAVAQEVVHLHRGEITVQSEVGLGTTFTVRLPVVMRQGSSYCTVVEDEDLQCIARDSDRLTMHSMGSERTTIQSDSADESVEDLVATEEDQYQHSSSEAEEGRRPVILSVDDDEINQSVIEVMIGDAYEVHVAMNGFEALEYLEQCSEPPGVIVLDVMMPGLSGIEVCRIVREKLHKSKTELPILMSSASGQQIVVEDSFEAGCNEFVTKPFQKQVLKDQIKTLLQVRTHHEKKNAAAFDKLQQQGVGP